MDMISSEIKFRNIQETDIPSINQLMRDGKGYWGYSEEGLDRFMSTFGVSNESYLDNTFGCIAESAQGIIGYYLFKVVNEALELDHFFLAIPFIGQGYGRHLWNHCINEAKQRGWKEFTFWSDPNSLGFYEHMGAVKIDERPMVTLPVHKAPIMRFQVPD